jgi:hypothetical protein
MPRQSRKEEYPYGRNRVIVSIGAGLCVALARTFADAGQPVAMLDRDKTRLDTAAELASTGQQARGYICFWANKSDGITK